MAAKKKNTGPAVVGIGASAGGIDVLNRFFDGMPAESGLAFVVVLHLDPTRGSELAPILGHHTSMPVVEIEDSMRIDANRVHVIVPDKSLKVEHGRLHLSQPTEPRSHRHPIDVFFASLAEHWRERAIGIVLSGTGNNGTHGLKEIKAAGGMTVAQDPETAQFDGMPRSAIGAAVVDHILAVEKMPEMLLRYARHGYVCDPDGLAIDAPEGKARLDPVLALLRTRTGHDFHSYKRGTIQRRINRRMGIANVTKLADYIDLLHANSDEVTRLAKDLMISVTSFFRDPEAWRALDETVLAPLFAERAANREIRIWVPACATGEEAYTLAMAAVERAEASQRRFSLKVFATDSQSDILSAAREGVYPEASLAGIPPERLHRFFDALGGATYRVKKELREYVVFAAQNLLRDPPFSRLDLITCRNMLIYLEPDAQNKVVALLHFALREGGHLFLGNAETIGRYDDLFEAVSKKWRIYRRIGPRRHGLVDFTALGASPRLQHAESPQEAEAPARAAEVARRVLLERYAPAAVLIDRKARILYFHGPTGDYLEQPSGEPTSDLLAMAREGMRLQLRAAVRQASDTNQAVTVRSRVRQSLTVRPVSVTVAPVAAAQAGAGLLLVTFEPTPEPPGTDRIASPEEEVRKAADDRPNERILEEELKSARAERQNAIEEMESANEELKSSNEEVTSVNEELQSTNEELETSKEELQSYNEELNTINSQLAHKVAELEKITNDQNNLLAGTDIATIFLDPDFRIKWFSPASQTLLDLVPSDIGRPLAHFAPKFTDPNMLGDARTALEKLTRIEAEIRSDTGVWYQRHMLPYRTQDNRIAGVVLTFVDITERKRADAMKLARDFAEAIVATVRQPLLVLDADLRVHSANGNFCDLFKVSLDETIGRPVYELGSRQWDIPELRSLLENVLPNNESFNEYEIKHKFEGIGWRSMLLNGRKLSGHGFPSLILLAIEDVTARQQLAEARHHELVIGELNHRVKNLLATVQSVASQTLRQSTSMESFEAAFNGRLRALARAHDLLSEEDWASTDIGAIVHEVLEPYRAKGAKRIAADGPRMTLPPQTSVALIMILHELATNAAKYGALSAPNGKLEVTWRRDQEGGSPQIRMRWNESNGPRVEPPSHQGFGTRLIERSAAHELHGKARLDYREEGLSVELIFPWEKSTSESKGI